MEYQHGGDIYRNRVELDYSANINPFGLPAGVKAALCQAVNSCEAYPDSRCERLCHALAEFHQVPAASLICGNGAADLIFQVVHAVKPRRALLLAPSFSEYEQALKSEDCAITYFELKEEQGFTLVMEALLDFLKQIPKPDMLFLCNPNNPTGLAVKGEEIKKLLCYTEVHGIYCVVDECFNEFLENPLQYSVLNDIRQFRHLFVLKAFTKIYAMAGVRLGYGICQNREILERMEESRQPWSVSSLAQAAGEAALKEREYVEKTRQFIAEERLFLKGQLEALGFQTYGSMANYLFFRAGKDLFEQCREKNVLIRSCKNYHGLDDTCYRICIRLREDNEKLLSVLCDIAAVKHATTQAEN